MPKANSKLVTRQFVLIVLTLILHFLLATKAFAHAHLVSPAPRDAATANKTGPCGPTPKPAVAPLTLTAGQQLTIQFEETIDHPGKYFISISPANDLNFTQLATVPDTQGGTLPHEYSYAITVPNMNCDNCTLQLIQSMEENPASPSFYYSCADVKITGATVTPPSPTPTPSSTSTGGPIGAQGLGTSPGTSDKAKMGSSCGGNSVARLFYESPGNENSSMNATLASGLFVVPFLLALGLQRRRRK